RRATITAGTRDADEIRTDAGRLRSILARLPQRALVANEFGLVGYTLRAPDLGYRQFARHLRYVPSCGTEQTSAQLNGSWPHYGRWCGSHNEIYGMSDLREPRPHSTLMPADLITLAHLSVSLAMNFANSSGENGIGSMPSSTKLACDLGSPRAAFVASLSLLTTSVGVFLGAPSPYQPNAS